MESNEMLRLDKQLCFKLYSVSRKLTYAYQPLLSKYNLTYPQYVVMLALFEHQSMDFKQLCQYVNLKAGTLTPIVKRLEQNGYLHRIPNPSDHRRMDIKLSEKGNAIKSEIIEVPLTLAKKLTLDPVRVNQLLETLDLLDELLSDI